MPVPDVSSNQGDFIDEPDIKANGGLVVVYLLARMRVHDAS